MRSSYKKLGPYIQEVNIRNKDLGVDLLLGVSIQKVLMPSIANTVGTRMHTYKVIKRNQFAYGPVTSRNGDKISIALLEDHNEAIVSQAYTVFEVKDKNELDPEYLMMWFRRPEYDRYARYHSHGSARETFDWEDLCETELPIPTIEKQREIVAEYNTVVNRIKLNEEINEKLEEAAQAIYKHWFVDFEFPIDAELAEKMGDPKLEGKPYKSSGGKLVYNEELDKEIPEGWESLNILDISDISAGGDKPKSFSEEKSEKFNVPIYSNGVTQKGLYGFTDKAKYKRNSITISARGTIGYCQLREEEFYAIVRLIVLTPKDLDISRYLFEFLKRVDFDNSGSVQNQLTKPQVAETKVLMPDHRTINEFDKTISVISNTKSSCDNQNRQLSKLKELLLSKMTKVEENIEKNVK